MSQTETYVESIGFDAAPNRTVDVKGNRVRGVKVLGRESKNNRTYTGEAMRRAVEMYEGAKVNVDHPAGRPDAPRQYQDRFGTIRSVQFREDGLYADLVFNPKHAIAEQFAWDAEHSPNAVGLSHNVQAKTTTRNGKTIVEEITCVQSVDLVADPATTRGLFESTNTSETEGNTMAENLAEATADDIRKHNPDAVKALNEVAKAGWLKELEAGEDTAATDKRLKEAEDKLAEAEKKLEESEKKTAEAEKQTAIAEELKAARLPDDSVSEVFTEQLALAADKAARARLIEDRKEMAGKAPSSGRPKSTEQLRESQGDGSTKTPEGAKAFAKQIKR